jgi:hypothetical protein
MVSRGCRGTACCARRSSLATRRPSISIVLRSLRRRRGFETRRYKFQCLPRRRPSTSIARQHGVVGAQHAVPGAVPWQRAAHQSRSSSEVSAVRGGFETRPYKFQCLPRCRPSTSLARQHGVVGARYIVPGAVPWQRAAHRSRSSSEVSAVGAGLKPAPTNSNACRAAHQPRSRSSAR